MNLVRKSVVRGALRSMLPAYSFLRTHPVSYPLLFLPTESLEQARWRISEWRVWWVAQQARNSTPAYRAFLESQHVGEIDFDGMRPRIEQLPVMDKPSYVNRYPIEERCVGGRFPDRGLLIDESSGSTGMPTNWVRSSADRADAEYGFDYALRAHRKLDPRPVIAINAFALGPWATGIYIAGALAKLGVCKNTGPDVAKIENTLRYFGDRYRFIVLGYPPFLKHLVDTAEIDWPSYTIDAMCGGEGLSEGLRTHLETRMRTVRSSYGASDIDINVAAETDFSVALRRVLVEREDVRRALLDVDGFGVPMVFQWNVLDYHIERNSEKELLITSLRRRNFSPKIRYNIHDLGQIERMPSLLGKLRALGVELPPPQSDLPVVMVYGRSDSTVAFFGSKIAPSHVEEALHATSGLRSCVRSFALLVHEDAGDKTLEIALEIAEGADAPTDLAACSAELLERLQQGNQDLRESLRMAGAERARISIHPSASGPFEGDDLRIKRRYIRRAT